MGSDLEKVRQALRKLARTEEIVVNGGVLPARLRGVTLLPPESEGEGYSLAAEVEGSRVAVVEKYLGSPQFSMHFNGLVDLEELKKRLLREKFGATHVATPAEYAGFKNSEQTAGGLVRIRAPVFSKPDLAKVTTNAREPLPHSPSVLLIHYADDKPYVDEATAQYAGNFLGLAEDFSLHLLEPRALEKVLPHVRLISEAKKHRLH